MSEHHRTSAWAKVLRIQKPRIAAALPLPCIEGCGKDVRPGEPFDLGHVISVATATRMGWPPHEIDAPSNLGPSHPRCNRSAGGKAGRAKQVAAQRQTRRLPQW